MGSIVSVQDENLSFFGFGLAVKGAAPITDIEIALAKMLEVLKKKTAKKF